jgi:hypothetical protein
MNAISIASRFQVAALSGAIALALSASASAQKPARGDEPAAESAVAKLDQDSYQNIYIVGLRSAPLAMADSAPSGLETLPRTEEGRLDVRAPAAEAYVERLQHEQDAFLAAAAQQLGRAVAPIGPQFRFQHAFNGMALRLSPAEATALAARPEVLLVEPYTEHPLDTDVGPTLIGAPSIWSGTSTPGALATRGEGTVIGVIDSGANLLSPSYATVDLDGYTHTNPLGSGNYLGWCNPSNPNHVPGRDICTDKLIGGWDFVDGAAPAGVYEAPGFEDENGHGSHTASTAGGNRRNATINGVNTVTSGVAPRANLIVYDACYTNTAGQGLCPNVSTLASINQAVADGIVDVINYSISGGTSPWVEANSLAFLAAHNAGIYVAASAGNSGPGPATLGHVEPWVSTTGASTHNRIFGGDFDMTGPAAPPPNTQNIPIAIGATPWPNVSTSGPLIVSPGFGNGATDGCAAFPAGTFSPSGIAVLRLDAATSACGSGTRRTNAINAGAIGVIFVDVGFLNLGANNTSWSMRLADWNNVAAHLNTDPPNASATISATAPLTNVPADVMAAFTSRGPSPFSSLKPDLTGPGVAILATVSRWNRTVPVPGALNPPPAEQNVGLLSGTSMSSPHHAGSAALLRALNRNWTPTQIKTALVSTTTTANLVKEDGVTPSDPFDRGSGRIDLTQAAKAGLVMDETGANFNAANPATGGNPSQLNLPNFQNLLCVGTCTFPRTVRGTRAQPVNWTATVSGLPTGAASVSPPAFSASSLNTASFTLNVDSLQLPPNQTVFGELLLTPSNPTIPASRMAIAVRRAPPDIDVSPTSIARQVVVDGTVAVPLTIRNVGNPTLDWSEDAAGQGIIALLQQMNNAANGFTAGFFNGQMPPGGIYLADDATPPTAATLATIRAEGFMTGTGTQTLPQLATSITFKVYSDTAGVPAGNPEAGAGGEIYSCIRTPTGPNSAGLAFSGTNNAFMTFDLQAAAAGGCPPAPALTGATRYWVSVFPTTPGTASQRRWAWFLGTTENGLQAQRISPTGIGGIPTTWTALAPTPPALPTLALSLGASVTCGAPWLDVSPDSASLGLGGETDATVTLNATGLVPGIYQAYVCISSNGTDPDEAKPVVPVTMDVRVEGLFSDGFEDPIR